ncbi:hypothetical protein BDW62DRAFT_174473 [Aspergillus aurantiobrunneus]
MAQTLTVRSPLELEQLINRHLFLRSANNIRIECPASYLKAANVQGLLKKHPIGNRAWFSYDPERRELKLFAMSRPLHDTVTSLFSAFMASAVSSNFIPHQLRNKILINPHGSIMMRSRELQSGSKVESWTKYPDLAITYRGEHRTPVVVCESGFSESYDDLKNEAVQWLVRSGGQVQLVLLVDIKEDGKGKVSCQKTPAAQQRLRQLIRTFGTHHVKTMAGFHGSDSGSSSSTANVSELGDDDDSDTSDPDMYNAVRNGIMVSDWVGPLTVTAELWELRGGVPAVRTTTRILPTPQAQTSLLIKLRDLIPPNHLQEIDGLDVDAGHPLDLDIFRELLQEGSQDLAFERAIRYLRHKPDPVDASYNPED